MEQRHYQPNRSTSVEASIKRNEKSDTTIAVVDSIHGTTHPILPSSSASYQPVFPTHIYALPSMNSDQQVHQKYDPVLNYSLDTVEQDKVCQHPVVAVPDHIQPLTHPYWSQETFHEKQRSKK